MRRSWAINAIHLEDMHDVRTGPTQRKSWWPVHGLIAPRSQYVCSHLCAYCMVFSAFPQAFTWKVPTQVIKFRSSGSHPWPPPAKAASSSWSEDDQANESWLHLAQCSEMERQLLSYSLSDSSSSSSPDYPWTQFHTGQQFTQRHICFRDSLAQPSAYISDRPALCQEWKMMINSSDGCFQSPVVTLPPWFFSSHMLKLFPLQHWTS